MNEKLIALLRARMRTLRACLNDVPDEEDYFRARNAGRLKECLDVLEYARFLTNGGRVLKAEDITLRLKTKAEKLQKLPGDSGERTFIEGGYAELERIEEIIKEGIA